MAEWLQLAFVLSYKKPLSEAVSGLTAWLVCSLPWKTTLFDFLDAVKVIVKSEVKKLLPQRIPHHNKHIFARQGNS